MIRTHSAARLTTVNWHSLSTERMLQLYARETERWSAQLEWDTSQGWEDVERGRQLATVSGYVVLADDGRAAGWCYFLVYDGTLQIGGFVADSDVAAQQMLDRIFSPETLAAVKSVTLFAFDDAPGLAAALRMRGLSVDRYWYLSRDLERTAPPRVPDLRRWREDDLKATAELFGRAYPMVDESRPFAPRGSVEEWAEYARQLTTGTGCGTLMPEACFAIPAGPGRLAGVIIVTRVGATMAHVAQLAVDPQMRGRQLGGTLIGMASATAAQAGCRRISLLVGGKNSRARGLYESLRFESTSSFLAAGTLQPRRSTNVAPGRVVIARR